MQRKTLAKSVRLRTKGVEIPDSMCARNTAAPMAHRAAPISVSVALGHTSANAVKAMAGGGLVH